MRDFGLSLLSSWELRCSGLLGYSLLNNPEQCSSQLKKSVFNSWKISMRLQDKRTSASIKQCRTEHPCFLAKERPLDCSCSYYYYYYIMIGVERFSRSLGTPQKILVAGRVKWSKFQERHTNVSCHLTKLSHPGDLALEICARYYYSSYYWASVANASNVLQPYWLIVLPLDVPDLTASLLLWGPSGQRWRCLWTFLFFRMFQLSPLVVFERS